MSVTVPSQLRSIDPYSENRFSDNYNIRSRMITGGKDVVLFSESFRFAITGDYTFTIKPGIAIKDDVMIHIMEDVDVDIRTNQGLMITTQSEPPIRVDVPTPYQIHIFLKYTYARTQPPPEATYEFIRSGTNPDSLLQNYTIVKHMWLGCVNIVEGIIDGISIQDTPVTEGENTVIFRRRYYFSPFGGFLNINCGVIREDEEWYDEWTE